MLVVSWDMSVWFVYCRYRSFSKKLPVGTVLHKITNQCNFSVQASKFGALQTIFVKMIKNTVE